MACRLSLFLSLLLLACFQVVGAVQGADWELRPNTLDAATEHELCTLAATLTQGQGTSDVTALTRFAALWIQNDDAWMAGEAPFSLSIFEFGRQTLKALPPKTLAAWRLIADEGVRTQSAYLKKTPHSATDALREMVRIQRVYPNSSYEAQLEEQITKLRQKVDASVKSAQAAPCPYHCSAVQVLDENEQPVFEDFLPKEAWGTLYPSREWKPEYAKAFFPERLATSADGEVVVARMGTSVSIWPAGQRDLRPQSYLVALEPKAEGRLRWLIQPDSPQWAFAGEPLILDGMVCVPMVQLTEPPRLYAAAFDLKEGALRWRSLLGTLRVSDEPYLTVSVPQSTTKPHTLTLGNDSLGFQIHLNVLDGHWSEAPH